MKISLHSSSTKMNSKLCLILLGALITLAVLSAAENQEENSLSEEVSASRLARAADADPGKSKKKSKRKNKKASKKNKSKRKNKKASKKEKKSKRKNNKKASKKDKKSKRKIKKASKKGKNSKRKNKKDRKKSKSKRKNKKNKSKKSRQNKRKSNSRKNKSHKKNREGEREVPDTCVTTAVDALYMGLSKKATNFDRQSKRIETRLPKIANKLGKASEYNSTLDDLVAANGSCPLGNVTLLDALVATLTECQTNIETKCAEPEYNKTQIDECKPIVEGFVSEVEKCVGLNSDAVAACECWESDAVAELEEGLKGCVIKESEANVTAAFKACKGAVSTCNKAQTEAIPVIVACSKTAADLVAEAETVANNIAALEGAKTAVESAAATRRRQSRAAATNCTEFIALVDEREFPKPRMFLD